MKLFIKILIIFALSFSYSYSACNFKVELGVKRDSFESLNFTGPPLPLEYENFDIYGILADDICPDQNLNDVAIEYKFLNDELVAINMIALNDDRNIVSESLIMMNYFKKNYGNFETPDNPRAFSGFEVIDKNNKFYVYQRIPNDDGIINEQIYISSPELDTKLMEYMQNLEEQQLKEQQ